MIPTKAKDVGGTIAVALILLAAVWFASPARAGHVDQVVQIPTETKEAVAEGLGCISFNDLLLAHQNPQMMQYQMINRKCGIIEPGDTYMVVVGRKRQGTVQAIVPGATRTLHVPAYVFGMDEGE